MPEQSKDDQNAQLESYLNDWAAAVRSGMGRVRPPAGRLGDAQSILAAVRQARGQAEKAEQVDPYLLKLADEAETAGFRPWEQQQSDRGQMIAASAAATRAMHLWPWLLAAACLPIVIGVGLWQAGVFHRADSARALAAALNLRVGYEDVAGTQRGQGGLQAGTKAKIFFTLAEPGYYSLLLLDQNLKLTCEKVSQRAEAGRHEVEWTLPAIEAATAEETVFVVAGQERWGGIESFIEELNSRLSGTRDARIDQLIHALGQRSELAVAHATYPINQRPPG